MQAQVKEWGNGQGVRLSKEILKSAGITLNDILDITVSNGIITLAKPFRHKTLEERAAEFDGRLMIDGEYDWVNRLEKRSGNGYTSGRYPEN